MDAKIDTAQESQISDDIPKETLISLLRDKSKELKLINNKLKKIEEKYVKVFKESKNLLKDKEVYEKLFQLIFNSESYKFTAPEMGTLDYAFFEALWKKNEEDRNQNLANIMSLLNQEKVEMEKKFKSNFEEHVALAEGTSKGRIETLELQKKELEQDNMKISKEIVELNDLLSKKNEELMSLKKVEHEFSKYKAEILLNELQKKNSRHEENSDVKAKIANAEKTNEIIKLNDELEKAHERIALLENEKNSKLRDNDPNKQGENSCLNSTSKKELRSAQSQTDNYQGGPLFDKGNHQKKIFDSLEDKMIELDKKIMQQDGKNQEGGDSKKINQEYLKNVILKYFIYLEGRFYKEAGMLMQVIFDILKFSPEEKNLIQQSRDRATLWNTAKNYLSETFFTKAKEINYQQHQPFSGGNQLNNN